MAINKVAPGEVLIESLTITSFGNTKEFELTGQVTSIVVYEDVFKPTIYAEIGIVDYFDILNRFPIIGEETINLSFTTPGASGPISYTFRVYSVADYNLKQNTKGATYTLKCVSEEQIYDTVNLVTKGYNTEITNIVGDILYNYMKSKKGFLPEPSKGTQQIIIPKMNPLMAIDFVRKRAVSRIYNSSSYVFFENSKGFNFTTLEYLFETNSKKIGTKVFTYNPAINTADDDKGPKGLTYQSFRNILKYTTTSKHDTIDKLQHGFFNNKTVNFDILSKKVTETDFKIIEKFSDFVFLDKDYVMQNSAKFMASFQNNEGHRYFIPSDSSRSDSYIEGSLGAKIAYYNMLSQQKTLIKVYGDTTMAAGDVITCNFFVPTSTGDNDKPDDRMGGNYLVTQLAHAIRKEGGNKFYHEMSIGLIKGNYIA